MTTVPKFIAISGLLGTGKSHFTTQLAGLLNYSPIYEPVETNPYLADFYKDPKKWAYVMQEHLLSMRFRLHQDAMWGIRAGRYNGVVFDRTIHEDTVFAEVNKDIGNIDDRAFQTYLAGFNDMRHYLVEPDVIIYLHAPPEVAKARADHRARPEEQGRGLRVGSCDHENAVGGQHKWVTESEGKPISPRCFWCGSVQEYITDKADTGIPLDYMKRLADGYQKWIDEMAPRMAVIQVNWEHFRPVTDVWPEVLSKLEERTRFTRSLCLP